MKCFYAKSFLFLKFIRCRARRRASRFRERATVSPIRSRAHVVCGFAFALTFGFAVAFAALVLLLVLDFWRNRKFSLCYLLNTATVALEDRLHHWAAP